jgi:pimeloyl-ACP methyl ester carboxylesterase
VSARSVHIWVRRAFLLWAVVSTTWLANSMRTRGLPESVLESSPSVVVTDRGDALAFEPRRQNPSSLLFICGSGVAAHAYAPLLRPIAEAGFAVYIVKLPYRFAPFDAHKVEALRRVQSIIDVHPAESRWIIAGHSLGGALAARFVQSAPQSVHGIVLIATTHPKAADLSALALPVTKIYASKDGVARTDRVQANRRLLPRHTKWVEIEGGNHSQFAHYGRQLFDGAPSIDRQRQQAITRGALLDSLRAVQSSTR